MTMTITIEDYESLQKDAARYRWLRDRIPASVLEKRGKAAGCWIDCEADDGKLILLTGKDADDEIDAAMKD